MQTTETGAREGVPDVHRITPAEVAEIAAVDARARAAAFAGLPAKIRALIYQECPWLPPCASLHVGLHSRSTPADDVPLPVDQGDSPAEWFEFESPEGVPCVSVASYCDAGDIHVYVGPRRPAPEVA